MCANPNEQNNNSDPTTPTEEGKKDKDLVTGINFRDVVQELSSAPPRRTECVVRLTSDEDTQTGSVSYFSPDTPENCK